MLEYVVFGAVLVAVVVYLVLKNKQTKNDFEIDEITAVNMRNQQLNNKLTVMASIEQEKVEQELKNNEGAMKLIGEAHLEIVKAQLEVWVEEEKNKIRKEMQMRMDKSD